MCVVVAAVLIYTVVPVMNGHPEDQAKVSLHYRWLLVRGTGEGQTHIHTAFHSATTAALSASIHAICVLLHRSLPASTLHDVSSRRSTSNRWSEQNKLRIVLFFDITSWNRKDVLFLKTNVTNEGIDLLQSHGSSCRRILSMWNTACDHQSAARKMSLKLPSSLWSEFSFSINWKQCVRVWSKLEKLWALMSARCSVVPGCGWDAGQLGQCVVGGPEGGARWVTTSTAQSTMPQVSSTLVANPRVSTRYIDFIALASLKLVTDLFTKSIRVQSQCQAREGVYLTLGIEDSMKNLKQRHRLISEASKSSCNWSLSLPKCCSNLQMHRPPPPPPTFIVTPILFIPSFSRVELKKVTDIFTRMFHDPHGKVRYNGMVVVIARLAEK